MQPPRLTFEMVITTLRFIFNFRSAYYQLTIRSFHERIIEPSLGISSL